MHGKQHAPRVLQGIESVDASLAVQERRAQERRRSPAYRADRAVRAALMLPAYIVSVIVGESAWRIDRSAWGMPLRVLAVVADGLAVYGGGKLLGLW